MTTSTKAKNLRTAPLKGEALLQRVQGLEHLSKEEKAMACGYYTVMSDGSERINLMRFLNALIDAQGIDLDNRSPNSGGRGPSAGNRWGQRASFHLFVQANGNLMIGSVYTKKLGINPGDEFEIKLGHRQIRLVQVES